MGVNRKACLSGVVPDCKPCPTWNGLKVNGLPYYPRYPRDFFTGTTGMSFEVKGAYSILLDLIYMSGGELYDEPRFIAGHMNCSVRAWGVYRKALIAIGKITIENGIIRNFRADKELIIQRSFQDKQRENGSRPKKNNNLGEAAAKPKASHTETHTDTVRIEAKASLRETPSRFDEFWAVYPHRGGAKKGRKASQAKYDAAVKRGVLEQDIIAGAERYGGDRGVIDGYAKDPATWLNGAGWQDEIETKGPMVQTQGGRNDGNSKGEQRMRAFLDGARGSPGMDRGQDIDPSRPLLARG